MTSNSTSLIELAEALRTEALSMHDYLDKLEILFHETEPKVKAFISEPARFSRLHEDADKLKEIHPDPAMRPALYGVPIGVKDIYHVDGFETRAGSDFPVEELSGIEADSVSRLKQAGALILGKTVTTEFAYFAPGPTCNPHNLDHTPGGSSSGSAAAVAAGLCTLTLGTQTIGSINRPAAFCGVPGFKPTYDRVNKAGVIPVSGSLDHVGFFTTDVQSAALAASILVPNWGKPIKDSRPTLGVPEGPYLRRVSAEGFDHFQQLCSKLLGKGFQITRVHAMSNFDDIVERHQLIMAAEIAQVHCDWFPRFESHYHEKTATLIREGMMISTDELSAAIPGREEFRQELIQVMRSEGIDLWIAPAAVGVAPRGLESTGDPIMNLPWTHSGLPVLTIPSGKDEDGLPYGLQLVGGWMEDEHLLAWAAEIERVLGYDG